MSQKVVQGGKMGGMGPTVWRLSARVAIATWGAVVASIVTLLPAWGQVSLPSVAATHTPPPLEGYQNPNFALPTDTEHALILGNWLLSPSAYAGVIYDTNPTQSPVSPRASVGSELTLNGTAARDTGIFKTNLHGMVDSRIYNNDQSSAELLHAANLGVNEVYSPTEKWTFNGQADLLRQSDLFTILGGTPNAAQNVTPINTTGNGLTPSSTSQTYNQLAATASGERRFGEAFGDLGASAVSQLYDGSSSTTNNNTVYTGTGRGGIWLTPDFYGFVEASLDSRNFVQSGSSSHGYRVVSGIGTGLFRLMKGEVYVGYQEEIYNSAALGTAAGPAFGGQLDYSPLPELDLKLGADRTIGTAVGTTATSGTSTFPGSAQSSQVTDVIGVATYSIAPEWSASASAGYIHTGYNGSNGMEDSWTYGPTLTYSVWQNFGVTLNYQHVRAVSNIPLTGFTRDTVTLGVSYRY